MQQRERQSLTDWNFWTRLAWYAVAFILAILVLVAVASLAQAQVACNARAEVVAHLANGYGERPVAAGIGNSGAVYEVFAAPSGASWTIIITMPDGVSCLVAAGEAWQPAAPRPAGEREG